MFVSTEGKSYPLGTLGVAKTSRKLDLYFNTSSNTAFYATGPGEVNLIGYFEPDGDSARQFDDAQPNATTSQPTNKQSSSEESSSEEEAPSKKPEAS